MSERDEVSFKNLWFSSSHMNLGREAKVSVSMRGLNGWMDGWIDIDG